MAVYKQDCTTDGCQRPPHAKGLCGACYIKARRDRLRESGAICVTPGCDRTVYNESRGLCDSCNKRLLAYGDPQSHGKRPDLGKPLEQRFWEKVDKSAPGGCWLWTASFNKGYGQFIVMRGERGWPVGAHRQAWELLRGAIPDGLTLDHLCRNRACVNPDHLEPVTNEENIRRGMWAPAANVRKTHCLRGHEFTPENTYRPPKRPDTRQCRACMRLRAQGKAA